MPGELFRRPIVGVLGPTGRASARSVWRVACKEFRPRDSRECADCRARLDPLTTIPPPLQIAPKSRVEAVPRQCPQMPASELPVSQDGSVLAAGGTGSRLRAVGSAVTLAALQLARRLTGYRTLRFRRFSGTTCEWSAIC